MNSESQNDIVIVSALRTPFCKANKGNFSDAKIDQLLTPLLKKSLENIKNSSIELILGNVLANQGGVVEARISALLANMGVSVPFMTINRLCASGLESIKIGVDKIRNGDCEVAVCGGFEIMSRFSMQKEFYVSDYLYDNKDNKQSGIEKEDKVDVTKLNANFDYEVNSFDIIETDETPTAGINIKYAKDCLISMGMTSETLAEKYKLTRAEIDEYALNSHFKAYNRKNILQNEIVPILVAGELVDFDDGLRKPDAEKLQSLKPVFKENGVSTAGNSCQLTDGASVVVIMKRSLANSLNLPVLCKYVDVTCIGVEPILMGEGPIYAIKKLLERNKLEISEIKLFEVNEAFGSQALCCMKELNIPHEKYNIHGGSIAIGHPIGATGGRLICSLINTMTIQSLKGYCIASLCAGGGMGIAGLFYFE